MSAYTNEEEADQIVNKIMAEQVPAIYKEHNHMAKMFRDEDGSIQQVLETRTITREYINSELAKVDGYREELLSMGRDLDEFEKINESIDNTPEAPVVVPETNPVPAGDPQPAEQASEPTAAPVANPDAPAAPEQPAPAQPQIHDVTPAPAQPAAPAAPAGPVPAAAPITL